MPVRNTSTRADRFIGSIIPRVVFDGEFIYRPVQLMGHPDSLHGVSINPLSTRTGIVVFRIPDEVITSGRPLVFQIDTSRTHEAEFSFTLN